MKNKNNIFLMLVVLFSCMTISCSDNSLRDADEPCIVLDHKRFKNLFAREHVEEVMQDARWPEYVVYARCNRYRCINFPPIVITPAQVREEYKNFQQSCYYFDEKARCSIVMYVVTHIVGKQSFCLW